MLRHLLLIGPDGTGKTSVLQKVLARLTRVRFGGYFARAPERGRRDRQIVVVRGRDRTLAERPLARESPTARLTVFDPSALLEDAVPAILEAIAAAEVVVVDGIGEVETRQAGFVDAVRRAFGGRAPVLATAPGLETPLARELAGRADVRVIRVDTQNRCVLDAEVADLLMGILRSGSCAAGAPTGPGSAGDGVGSDPTTPR